MHSAIESMLEKYILNTNDDRKNALKEIVQEIALLGLYRSGFFKHAAFYGGTCLRIFYNLNRFSEDLDFSLINPDINFNIGKYSKFIQNELASYGFEMVVEEKEKTTKSSIKSAFIKGDTHIHLLKIMPANTILKGIHSTEKIKIKLELDVNPPFGANYDVKYHLNPAPFSVNTFSLDSLFAGKVHAVLCRNWGNRVKGRDFYDYIWYLSRGARVNILHLEMRMQQSGHIDKDRKLNLSLLKQMLLERFSSIDFNQAKEDVLPFIDNPKNLDLWSNNFFSAITEKLKEF